ncbi:Ferric uptake regulation protein [Listeria rocourtiae FSL F6-920]|nr:Ferric uptake regulation protein [Listeria rocourtiae FSL F6-920]
MLKKIVEQKWDFLVKDHRLTFQGICTVCKTSMKKAE